VTKSPGKTLVAAAGAGIVAVHAIAFVAFADRARGSDLEVALHGTPLASAELAIDASTPPELASRVTIDNHDVSDGAGLAHRRWTAAYRGGFARSAGATQLVGPFQDPAAHACTGRVIIGQKMLAAVGVTMTKMLEAELAGEEIFGAGSYQKVSDVTLGWAELAKHPDDKGMIGEAPHGYVRVTLRLVFERVEIPVIVALLPKVDRGQLHFELATRAELDFDNRVLQWASDKVGGNKLASRLARRQIDQSLITTLAPPPPFDLPGGQRIEFTYCDEPPDLHDNAYAALPFAVTFGRVDGSPMVLPPRLGRGPHVEPDADVGIALDLELDALNALLFELWRGGFLDRQLADVGLDRQFNRDPLVTEYLSIRISPLRLALPPVITADRDGLRMAADGRVAISDGSAVTTGRVFGGLSFNLAATSVGPVGVDLRALELSCEKTATTLVPCYADLVGALRDRGADFHGVLTSSFTKLLNDIFVAQRVGASGVPVDLVIGGVHPSVTLAPPNGTLRLALDAELAPTK
jgi:hypothetical protein